MFLPLPNLYRLSAFQLLITHSARRITSPMTNIQRLKDYKANRLKSPIYPERSLPLISDEFEKKNQADHIPKFSFMSKGIARISYPSKRCTRPPTLRCRRHLGRDAPRDLLFRSPRTDANPSRRPEIASTHRSSFVFKMHQLTYLLLLAVMAERLTSAPSARINFYCWQ